jgi:hypothetical protein
MHVNRGLLSWGLFLILAGLIPLAERAGLISAEQLLGFWNLWPLILIGIGVGLVLSRTSFAVLGSLIVAGTFGLMVGAFLAVGIGGFPGGVCGDDRGTEPFAEQTGTFEGTAEIDVEFNCGELDMTGIAGTSWTFGGNGEADRDPGVEATGDSLRIRAAERSFVPFASSGESWEVGLPQAVPLGLRVQLNAGRASLAPGAGELGDVRLQVNAGAIVANLGEAVALESIDVQTNAGSASVILPAQSVTGRVQVNAGSIELCTPEATGIRIHSGGGLSGNNFADAGLEQSGETWESPGYATATTQIELDAEANLGSISLNPDDGCDDS